MKQSVDKVFCVSKLRVSGQVIVVLSGIFYAVLTNVMFL